MAAIALLPSGCSTVRVVVPDPPMLSGRVILEDSTGARIHPPYSGIWVKLSGLTTAADDSGKWTFQTVPSGSSYLVASKDGFDDVSIRLNVDASSFYKQDLILTTAPQQMVHLENAFDWETMMAVVATCRASSSGHVFFFTDKTPDVSRIVST